MTELIESPTGMSHDTAVAALGMRQDESSFGEPAKARQRPLGPILCAGWLALVTLLVLGADLLPLPHYGRPVGRSRLAPGSAGWSELLGTDELGRSELSRIIFGARVSLAVSVGALAIGLVVGGLHGLVAGYFRGWFESVSNVLNTAMLAFPPLVLLLTLTYVLTPSFKTLFIGLGVFTTPAFYRVARACTLPVAKREFVIAARAMGAKHSRILLREIVPNVLPSLGAYAFAMMSVIIVAEGSLSFLGLGIPSPQPSWGGMIASGRDYLDTRAHLVFVPATALLFTVLSFNIIGDWARERFDLREGQL